MNVNVKWIVAVATATVALGPSAAPAVAGEGTITGLGKCLTPGHGGEDGAPVQIATCDSRPEQVWSVRDDGTIRSSGGRCLDARDAGTSPGTEVIVWPCHGGSNQNWVRSHAWEDGGRARLSNGDPRQSSRPCLDVRGGQAQDGTPVILWDCHGGANQQWDVPAPPPEFHVRYMGPGTLCMGATSAALGTPVTLQHCGSGADTRVAYRHELRIHGRCVDIRGEHRDPGGRLILWDCARTWNQRWRDSTTAGGFRLDMFRRIENPETRLVIEAAGPSQAGTPLHVAYPDLSVNGALPGNNWTFEPPQAAAQS